MTKPTFDIERVEEALRVAAARARYGTRDERSGRFLGKQVAVEKAVASLQHKKADAQG